MINLKGLINEDTRNDDYGYELQVQVQKELKGTNHKGWKLNVDHMSGAFEYVKKGISLVLLITPMWDGNEIIPYNAMDSDGETVEELENIIKTVKFKPSYDLEQDTKRYFIILTKLLQDTERIYKKLKL